MNDWVKKNLWGLMTMGGIVAGVVWVVTSNLRMFTTPEDRIGAEEFHKNADLDKVYGEYILDSIEEVQTQQWRRKQEIKDSLIFKKLNDTDSLVRLGVFLSNKAAKATDTLNRNLEHTLEHVDQ